MNYSVQLKVTEQGEFLDVWGVNFGYSNGSTLKIVYKDNPYYIVRCRSGSDWSGRGETTYYPSEYYLWKRVGKHTRGKNKETYWDMEKLEEVKVGKNWKASLQQLIQKIEGYKK